MCDSPDATARRNLLANAMELVDVSRKKVGSTIRNSNIIFVDISEYHRYKSSHEGHDCILVIGCILRSSAGFRCKRTFGCH